MKKKTFADITLFFITHKIAVLFLAASLLLFCNLGKPSIYILDEARNAQAAREMMNSHEWIIPTFNGNLRSQKPPLHYYFMGIAYRVFGTNAFAARFFSALMGLFTLWITWFFTRRFLGSTAAFGTALALVLSTHFLFEFRLSVPDPFLIFFVTAGSLTFYAYVQERKFSWLIFSATAFSLAILSKGPVFLAIPGLAIVCWLIVEKKMRILWSWQVFIAFVLLVSIALPWYLAVHRLTAGQFTREFFLQQNFSRFNDTMEGHGGIFLLVPLIVWLGLLPLSIFIFHAIKKWKLLWRNQFSFFCILLVAVFTIVFSISKTKLPNYAMPAYPFIAILFGQWFEKIISGKLIIPKYGFATLLVLNIVLLAAATVGLYIEPATRHLFLWSLIFIIPITTISLLLIKKSSVKKRFMVLGFGYVLFNFTFLVFAYPAVYKIDPVSKTKPLFLSKEQTYAYKIYNPAFNFILEKPVIILENKTAVAAILNTTPAAKIITRENLLPELDSIPFRVLAKERDLFETPVTVILSGQ